MKKKKKQSDKKLSKKNLAKMRAYLDQFKQEDRDPRVGRKITRTTPSKPKKNVYKLVTMLVETQKTAPGAVCTTYQNRTVATFTRAASLDLMKPLLAAVRARHRFVRWEDRPTQENLKKLNEAWVRAKNLLAKCLMSQTNPDPTSYQASVLGLCTELLEGMVQTLTVNPGGALADDSQIVQPADAAAAPSGEVDSSNSTTTAAVEGSGGQIKHGRGLRSAGGRGGAGRVTCSKGAAPCSQGAGPRSNEAARGEIGAAEGRDSQRRSVDQAIAANDSAAPSNRAAATLARMDPGHPSRSHQAGKATKLMLGLPKPSSVSPPPSHTP
ncbi:hypothetical protein DYH09_35045, partial [bacterium CPR1]|nr:hypothetical protein [bacterium CPR1]